MRTPAPAVDGLDRCTACFAQRTIMVSWSFSETGRSGDLCHGFGPELDAMRHALEARPKRLASLVSNTLGGPILFLGIAQSPRRHDIRRGIREAVFVTGLIHRGQGVSKVVEGSYNETRTHSPAPTLPFEPTNSDQRVEIAVPRGPMAATTPRPPPCALIARPAPFGNLAGAISGARKACELKRL